MPPRPSSPCATSFASSWRSKQQIDTADAPPSLTTDPEARLQEQLREVLVVLVLGLPLIVVLAGAGGYVLARRALAPIDHLAAEARRLTADRLHERLSVPNQHDEVGRLAAVFNDTFARLEASFGQLGRFTADASHELRTPLAVIRGIGEMALRETRTPADYKDAIGSMLEDVDRLTRLVDTLLRLSRGDAGTIRLSPDVVDLGELARDVVSSLGILAEERRQRLQIAVAANVRVAADRLVLRDAITNVVDNAIKYGPPDSAIACAGRREWAAGDADRGRSGARHSRPSIANASSTASIASMKGGRARAAGPGSAWRSRNGPSRSTAATISLEPAASGSLFRIVLPRIAVSAPRQVQPGMPA